jgi:hypothetical protein
MKINEGIKNVRVYSNLDGRTLLSIKPNTAKKTDKRKKTDKLFFTEENLETGVTKFNFTHTNTNNNYTNTNNNYTNTFSNLPDVKEQMRNTISNFTVDRDAKNQFSSLKEEKEKIIQKLEEKIKMKDLHIRNLEKKIKSLEEDKNKNDNFSEGFKFFNNGTNSPISFPLEEMDTLFQEFKSYVEKDITGSDDSVNVKKNILKVLENINNGISSFKLFYQNYVKKDKSLIADLKAEVDKLKEKNLILTGKCEKLSMDSINYEKQIINLKGTKKIEKIKKVIEAKSDTYLAKENEDLKRRLQTACNFILEKKERIEKQNEKINSLSRKINEILKSNTFSEDEERKIKEKIALSLKSHNITSIEPQITGEIVSNLEYRKIKLNFRIEKLDKKYQRLIQEILDNGTSEFIKHFFISEKTEQEKLLEFITDQMLSYMDLSNRFNLFSKFVREALFLNKEDMILSVRSNLYEMFDSERCTLWVLDQNLNEFYTVINFLKYSEPASNSYFQDVIKGEKIYNKYLVDNNSIYSKNLEKKFSSSNTKSVLSKCITDPQGQLLGIIEVVNSNNVIFGYDEEYLIYLISDFIRWALDKFLKQEADEKYKSRETLYMSVIQITSQKTLSNLFLSFEAEITKLLDAYQAKLILVDKKSIDKKLFSFSSNQLINQNVGGIAGISLISQCGIYCKYPNEDPNYNPLIDVEITQTNFCFYSIPLRKDLSGVFGILQYVMERDETYEVKYESSSSHQISKLDYYMEKIIDIMSITLQNALVLIDPQYFNI